MENDRNRISFSGHKLSALKHYREITKHANFRGIIAHHSQQLVLSLGQNFIKRAFEYHN